MFYIINQENNKITVLDSNDSTMETISLEFYNKLEGLINMIDVSPEQLLLNKMMDMDKEDLLFAEGSNNYTVIFTKFDSHKTARNKITSLPKGCNVNVYNFSDIKDMSNMFRDCRAKSLNLSNFDTSKVTDMAYMFSGVKVTSLDLSGFDTSKVKDMNGMFCACHATFLDISNFDTSVAENYIHRSGDMFFQCKISQIKVKRTQTFLINGIKDKTKDKTKIEYVEL